ncbi:MAG TPA: hypothetical protein DD426_09930 [Clostridiaceae bacterium]|nr:hypothetical protein [Clostridiaceae bacterium]
MCLIITFAQAWLAKDVNKAAEAIQKATDLKNSSSNRKDAKAILDYQKAVKNGKPYEGCLQLIESGTIYDDNIKKAAIEKLLKEYPGVKNSARNKLEVIKSRLDSGK